MLYWIIKDGLLRLYDVISVIIFSTAVNIIVWGFTIRMEDDLFYGLIIASFCSLLCSGWCFYWLHEEVGRYLIDAAGVERTAVINISEKGMSSSFKRHFALAILCFIIGIISFYFATKLQKCL